MYKTVIWKPMNKRYENKQNHSHNTILRGEKILWKKNSIMNMYFKRKIQYCGSHTDNKKLFIYDNVNSCYTKQKVRPN